MRVLATSVLSVSLSLVLGMAPVSWGAEYEVIKLPEGYDKLNPDCHVCEKFDRMLGEYSKISQPDKRLDMCLKIAHVIGEVYKPAGTPAQLYSMIYYSINAAMEIMPVDFDGEAGVELGRLRTKFPKQFDNVFWRFPMSTQRQLATRIDSMVKRKLVPGGRAPTPRVVVD